MKNSPLTPALLFLVFCGATAAAQGVSVSDVRTVNQGASEAQSTVIPPGVKMTQCPEGRFLATNDWVRPPNAAVWSRALDDTTGAPTAASFDLGAIKSSYNDDPKLSKYSFLTNDHDLLTLPNGDVLYLTGAGSRMPLAAPGSRPLLPGVTALMSQTFRNMCVKFDAAGNCAEVYPFGPLTRSNLLVFRSTDCGQKFTFVSEMDPMVTLGGFCAMPQFGATPSAPYDMGGSDGQLARVDSETGLVYLTFQCVGYNADDIGKSTAVLDQNKKINQTLVAVWDPVAGGPWQGLGSINLAQWRLGVVPLSGGDLAFGLGSSVVMGRLKKFGLGSHTTVGYTFDQTGVPAPNGSWSWMGAWNFGPGVALDKGQSNVYAQPVITRTRDSKSVVLAFPDSFGTQGLGYRVFFYDRQKQQLAEATRPILPATADASNLAFHLAAVEAGGGPVLLYWFDLDSATKRVKVRGRLITGLDEFSDDFTISRAAGADYDYEVASGYFIGDYHTAGGFHRKVGPKPQGPFAVDLRPSVYSYFPVWVQSDGTTRYARVDYAVDMTMLAKSPLGAKVAQVKFTKLSPDRWRAMPAPVELSRITVQRKAGPDPDRRRPPTPQRRRFRPRPLPRPRPRP